MRCAAVPSTYSCCSRNILLSVDATQNSQYLVERCIHTMHTTLAPKSPILWTRQPAQTYSTLEETRPMSTPSCASDVLRWVSEPNLDTCSTDVAPIMDNSSRHGLNFGPVGQTAAQVWSIAHHFWPIPVRLWSSSGPTATAFGPTPAHVRRVRPELARIGRSSAAKVGQNWPDLGQTLAKVGPAFPRGWPSLANPGPTVDNIGLNSAENGEARVDRLRERDRQMHRKCAAMPRRMSSTGAAPDRNGGQSARLMRSESSESNGEGTRNQSTSTEAPDSPHKTPRGRKMHGSGPQLTHVRKCWVSHVCVRVPRICVYAAKRWQHSPKDDRSLHNGKAGKQLCDMFAHRRSEWLSFSRPEVVEIGPLVEIAPI